MLKKSLFMMALLLVIVAVAYSQSGYVFSGRLGATDQEAQEGYFALDSFTMIVVKPGSEAHTYLRSKVGQRIKITIEPDSNTN